MVGVVVRSSNPGDCEPAFAVWRAAETARRGGPPPSTTEQRVRGYVRRAGAVLLVADAAGEVVGMAILTPTTSRPTDISTLQMVFVAPERWGEGIGGRLVDAALAEARARGFKRVQLWTHACDERGRRLYEGRGFRRTGRQDTGESGEQIVHYERLL